MKLFFSILFLSVNLKAGEISNYRDFFDAAILEKEGKYEEAFSKYKDLIKKDPDLYVYKQALNLSMSMGKIKESLEYSSYLVEKDSNSAENWYMYANSLWAAGENEKANSAFLKAIELNKEYVDAYYQLSLLNAADKDKAIGYLKKIIELRPDLKPETYMQIAQLYYANKDEKNALDYLKKSAAEDLEYTRPRYYIAEYYENNGDYAKALEEYNAILEQEKNNSELLNHIGEIYLSNLKDQNKAREYFSRSVEVSTKNPQALYWLMVISEQEKKYSEAIEFIKRLNEIMPSPSNYLKMSYCYSALNDLNKAVETLKIARGKFPDDPDIAYFLALGYEDMGKLKESVELLKFAVSKSSESVEARMQLAISCEKLNDVPCFKENFSYIIEKDTANHNALNYLGYSLIDRNMELDKAIDMVKKALSYDPDNPAYLDSLAWGYYRKGDYKEALAAILKSIEKMDYDSIVWEHLGHIYLKLGDFDNAWFSFQLSNDLNNQEKNIKLAYDLKDKVNFQKAIERYFSLISLKKASFVSNGELSIKFSGRRISADMVISNKPGEYFFVSILDPLMSPMWSVKYTTSSVHYSNISGDLAYGEYLNLTLNRISDLLKDIYGGGIYDLPYGNIKNRVLEDGDYKIKLNKDKNRIESIVYKKGGEKIKVYFKNYDFISNYLFPVEVVVKSDKLTFTIKLPKNKIEVKNINKLAL